MATVASQISSVIVPSYYSYFAETGVSAGQVDPKPTDTGAAPLKIHNATLHNTRTYNSSCTVHIPDASIEWWYPPTYRHPLATITSIWGNYSNTRSYTFIPHTTTFDAVSALATEDVCTYGWITYTEWDWTAWECMPYTEKPTAASTTVVFRTAVPSIPSGGEIDIFDIQSYDVVLEDLPSPSIIFSVAPNVTSVETAPTPFVHFTAYEVEHKNSTETIQLSSVYVQSYWGKNFDHEATAAGLVPPAFMEQIPQSACELGNLQAVVTVIIFVDLYYVNQPMVAPGIVHWESTALGWGDDSSVGAMDQTSSLKQHIMTDWDLSSTTMKLPQSVTVKPNGQPERLPSKSGGGAQPAKEPVALHPNLPIGQTAGIIGTAPVVVGPPGVVIVGSQTLKPGGPAITVDGTPVVLGPSASAVIIGGTSLPLPQNLKPGQQQTVGILGTTPVVVGPSSVVVIGTQTLQPGGAPITIGHGTPVSLALSATAIFVGGTTSLLPQVARPANQLVALPPPVLTLGSMTLVPNAATWFFFGPGKTLIPGGAIMIDGTKVSLDSLAAFVVVGSSTQRFPAPAVASGQVLNRRPEFVLGGSTFTALPTGSRSENVPGNDPNSENDQDIQGLSDPGPTFVVSGQTLAPGGPPITVSGKVLSLAPSGTFLVIDGSTTTITTPAAMQITPPPLTIGNGVFEALPGPGTTYQIGTALLTPGGSIVVDGTTISLAEGATAIIVNGVTTTLSTQAQPIITNPPLLTIGGHTYTAVPGVGTTFIIGGQTLTSGGTITVDGTTIVLSPQATELVYGSSGRSTSTALFPATTTRGTGATSTTSGGATQGQSDSGQPAPTTTREGSGSRMVPAVGLSISVLGSLGWLLS